jgi:hypothetical protein
MQALSTYNARRAWTCVALLEEHDWDRGARTVRNKPDQLHARRERERERERRLLYESTDH